MGASSLALTDPSKVDPAPVQSCAVSLKFGLYGQRTLQVYNKAGPE